MNTRHHRTQLATPAPAEPAALSPLLTVADVARLLQMCRVTVYTYIRTQGLPTIKIHGALRVEPAALEAWIKQHRQD